MFVKFGEKLRSKRFDPKDLKNTLFGLLKAYIYFLARNRDKQTFVVFVKFCEKLCSKIFDTNDLENTLFGLLKA